MAKSTSSKATPKAKPSATPGTTKDSDMKTSEIRDLIDFISKTGLNEVNIETRELKLHVKREPDQKILKSAAPVVAQAAAPVATQSVAPIMTATPTPKRADIKPKI